MKENIRKPSALVGVPVIALLITVVVASAGSTYIKGKYATSGFSSCSIAGSPAGSSHPGILELEYTFSSDGTGSLTGFGRDVDAPDANGNTSASFSTITASFTYTVTKEGHITFAYPNGGMKVYQTYPTGEEWWMQWDNGPSHGFISPDHKTITILCGPPVFLTGLYAASANSPFGAQLPEMTAYCVTSLVGMRIK